MNTIVRPLSPTEKTIVAQAQRRVEVAQAALNDVVRQRAEIVTLITQGNASLVVNTLTGNIEQLPQED